MTRIQFVGGIRALQDYRAANNIAHAIAHNDGGLRFSRRARASEVANAGWAYGPSLPDLNGDGWLDVYVPCGFQSVSRDAADG